MKPLLTVNQLGIMLAVKPKTLYLWAATGQIPSVSLNGLVRFDLDEVLKWIEANQKAKKDADHETMLKRSRKWRR